MSGREVKCCCNNKHWTMDFQYPVLDASIQTKQQTDRIPEKDQQCCQDKQPWTYNIKPVHGFSWKRGPDTMIGRGNHGVGPATEEANQSSRAQIPWMYLPKSWKSSIHRHFFIVRSTNVQVIPVVSARMKSTENFFCRKITWRSGIKIVTWPKKDFFYYFKLCCESDFFVYGKWLKYYAYLKFLSRPHWGREQIIKRIKFVNGYWHKRWIVDGYSMYWQWIVMDGDMHAWMNENGLFMEVCGVLGNDVWIEIHDEYRGIC